MFRGYLAARPYPRDTCENQLSPSCPDSSHSSHVLGTCFTSQEGFSQAICENFFALHFALRLHTLSHTKPLQWNPTWNTGYTRLNINTIKFGTKLKLTQNSCKSQLYNSFLERNILLIPTKHQRGQTLQLGSCSSKIIFTTA